MSGTVKFYGTGRRKTSVARVWVMPGFGNVTINDRPCEEYFPIYSLQHHAKEPLIALNLADKVDVWATVRGGGISGQAGAVRLGIARALVQMDERLRPILRKGGFLTRDPRMVERKKYGQSKARKRFQFSKR